MVQDVYDREPHLTARILSYWSNAFSAAVSIGPRYPSPWVGGVCVNFFYIHILYFISRLTLFGILT